MARALDSPDVFLNPLASGIKPIPAARGTREMAVTLDSPDRVRPGERLAIGYSAPKAGWIAIWAVDEGIHLVSKYQAPDPLAKLLPTAALEVTTYQLMDVLLPEFTLLRKAMAIGTATVRALPIATGGQSLQTPPRCAGGLLERLRALRTGPEGSLLSSAGILCRPAQNHGGGRGSGGRRRGAESDHCER